MNNKLKLLGIIYLAVCLATSIIFIMPTSSAKSPIIETPNVTTRIVGVGQIYTTIQSAINAASEGDTISVLDGTYYENIIVDKSLTLIGESSINTIIDGGGIGNTITIITNYVNITGFMITNGDTGVGMNAGIYLDNVQYCIIWNNNVSSNINCGITLYLSDNNTINNNSIWNNVFGICIYGFYNTIDTNIINLNVVGIMSAYSNYNIIINNSICFNYQVGYWIEMYSSYNIITKNIISNNEVGINVTNDCNNNTIFYNLISYNSWGIVILYNYALPPGIYSQNNLIHQNDFLYNTIQVQDNNLNCWNNNLLGNYWSDYIGVDDNNDFIGDWSYNFTTGQDNYPLMYSFENYIPPTIIYTNPINNSTGISLYTLIIITFSRDMNTMVYTIDTNLPNVTYTWTNDSSIIIGYNNLEYHTEYYIYLSNFTSNYNIEMVNYNFTFTTIAPVGELIANILISALPIVIIMFAVVMVINFINKRKKE